MGCEVTSVYNDEVLGKMGLPQPLIDDLIARDYATSHQIPNTKEVLDRTERVYGFNQLSLGCGLFLTTVTGCEEEQYVYVAGRFVVMEGISGKGKQHVMVNRDVITACTVEGAACAVGLRGGRVVLWDLQFRETKIEIMLPEGCLIVSSVGITPKYLVVTDSSQPNNFVFFYQRRTAKMKAFSKIPSLQPIIKSITVRNTHVTASADGLWFFNERSGELDVLKGMFGRYPKTSMLCLGASGDYVVSGGVDGYLYVWRASSGQCIKALRVSEGEIGSIGIGSGHLVIGCWDGKVKAYSFSVTATQKKVYNINIENEEEQPEQTITFILTDSYDVVETLSQIAFSSQTPHIYLYHTRQGVACRRSLPMPQLPKKAGLQNAVLTRWNGKANKDIHEDKIHCLYLLFDQVAKIDEFAVQNKKAKFMRQRKLNFKTRLSNKPLAYDPFTQQIAVVDEEGNVWVGAAQQSQQAMVASIEESINKVATLGKEVTKLQFVRNKELTLLCITNAQKQLWIYERKEKVQYEELKNFALPKQTPPQVQLRQGLFLHYEPSTQLWAPDNELIRPLSQKDREYMSLVHGGFVQSMTTKWSVLNLSAGGDFLLVWK